MDRNTILDRLRPHVKDLFISLEKETKLEIEVESLSANVVAQYSFTPPNRPIILLRGDWEDVDVAHELVHMKLELIEGYSVLAWRRNIEKSRSTERASARIRGYVDDEVVHRRLVKYGYELDGEVLKSQLFDDVYTNVPNNLKKLPAPLDDGMAHLDEIGYGDLCRSSFLVQAQLILEYYSEKLKNEHLELVKRFIEAFRTHRSRETENADRILSFFKEYDVQLVEGHKQILFKWAQMEGLDQFFGISSYQRHESGYILPWP